MPQELSPQQRSLCETLTYMTAEIYQRDNMLDQYKKRFQMREMGFLELNLLLVDWALEFEEQNEGREWDGEWMDEIDLFLDKKLFN